MKIQKYTQKFTRELILLLSKNRGRLKSKIYWHWKFILTVFVVLNVFLLAFSFYLFLKINEGDIFLISSDVNVSIDTIDRGNLQIVLDSFEEKKSLFELRKVTRPSISDPSQ